MVILSVLLAGVPSCDSSTFVLGTLEGSVGPGGAGGAGACGELGQSCADWSDCCSGECVLGACSIPTPACRGAGRPCTDASDCCSLSCVDGECGSVCVADGADCDQDEQCCSGICDGGSCATLNTSCFTSGNPCTASDDCCSGLCDLGFCSTRSSYCNQPGDVCHESGDCCSETCVMVDGETVGICAAPPPGPAFCMGGIAGSLCDDCNDCCSRLCIPFGDAGTHICAQARGCRQTGELCKSHLDCCGGDPDSSLPGAGNVECARDEGEVWGICRNAMACSPQGNACHRQDYACSVSAAANRCCDGDVAGECELDVDGVPRCNGLRDACQELDEPCATSEDCCDGSCRPADGGGLTCQESLQCAEADGACTTTSECCPGLWCATNPTEPFGRCSEIGAVECGVEGQICGAGEAECCSSWVCDAGRCRGGSE